LGAVPETLDEARLDDVHTLFGEVVDRFEVLL
jgi:cyclophilin family peptidyl-prolyl cis-trans isomerase